MATTAMVDSYVRQLLRDVHGEELQELDGSYLLAGDHPVRVWVVDGNHRTCRVLVTAVVLSDVEADAAVFEAVNDLNAVTVYGRFFVVDGAVHVEDTVLGDVLDPASLYNSIGFVTWAAESQEQALRERLGLDGDPRSLATSEPDEAELAERAGLELPGDRSTTPGAPRREVVVAGGYL